MVLEINFSNLTVSLGPLVEFLKSRKIQKSVHNTSGGTTKRKGSHYTKTTPISKLVLFMFHCQFHEKWEHIFPAKSLKTWVWIQVLHSDENFIHSGSEKIRIHSMGPRLNDVNFCCGCSCKINLKFSQNWRHFSDLKGAPPKLSYLKEILPLMAQVTNTLPQNIEKLPASSHALTQNQGH